MPGELRHLKSAIRPGTMRAALVMAVLFLTACSAPPPPSSMLAATPTASIAPTIAPSPTPTAAPAFSCGQLSAADCQGAVAAVLDALPPSGGMPERVELDGGGVYCPIPDLLFGQTTCPAGGLPPEGGGSWIGHALVSYVRTASQGYLNVWKNGSAYGALFIADSTPEPSPS